MAGGEELVERNELDDLGATIDSEWLSTIYGATGRIIGYPGDVTGSSQARAQNRVTVQATAEYA